MAAVGARHAGDHAPDLVPADAAAPPGPLAGEPVTQLRTTPEDPLWPLCGVCARKVSKFTLEHLGATATFRAECHGEVEECEVSLEIALGLLGGVGGVDSVRLRPDRAFPSIAFRAD